VPKPKSGRHRSAEKANRQSREHAIHNQQIRSRIHSLAKKIEDAVTKKDAPAAKALLSEAFSLWDKAAKVHLIHRKAADRTKARLSRRIALLKA